MKRNKIDKTLPIFKDKKRNGPNQSNQMSKRQATETHRNTEDHKRLPWIIITHRH